MKEYALVLGKRIDRRLRECSRVLKPTGALSIHCEPPLHAHFPARLGYATQKPLTFLDRMLKSRANEGAGVLDPFGGGALLFTLSKHEAVEEARLDLGACMPPRSFSNALRAIFY